MNRETLPGPTQIPYTATPMDVRDAGDAPEFPKQPSAPEGAPNVLLILIDDMGFGASSSFGGPCRMPTSERLAANGLSYTRFHTTAMCSPTRASLMTGRNHHSVGMGTLTDLSTGYPGYTSIRPNTAATMAQVLRHNGYNTAAFGKWHQTPTWEIGASGPFDRWPSGEGFERFYGFMGGETDQWNPTLFDGFTPVTRPDTPDYHLSEDLADRAISFIREQHGLAPAKPWFTYLSFGATHAPHHVPDSYRDEYIGQFDDGWDAQRERTLARQKELGIVPESCDLTARPDEIPAWNDLSDDHHRLHTRMMETYAAFATHTDEQVGRVIDALEALDQLDNTLIVFVLGDNGASAEAGPDGTLNEFAQYNIVPETIPMMLDRFDEIGGPTLFNHYPVGWAHCMNTPYQWTKQCASHWGGTRNGMIVHWPDGFDAKGELRHQFTHCSAIAPTVFEAAGIPHPTTVDGVDQQGYPSPAINYSFADADADERQTTQYFELMGNRAIYHEGWSACTLHSIPWELKADRPPFDEDRWELYAPDDHSQAHDVAKEHPDRLAKMKELFLIEATKFNVFPLDDRKAEKLDPASVRRPDPMAGRTTMTVYPGAMHLSEASVVNVKNCDHSITAEIEVEDAAANGVIVVQGGRFGGYAIYLRDGVPTYCYNWVDHERYYVKGEAALEPGRHKVRIDFKYDGGGAGKGGDARLLVDGAQVGEGRIANTCGYMFATTDAMDVGCDTGSQLIDDYGSDRGVLTGASVIQVDFDTDPVEHPDPLGMVKAFFARH
jgi:arylsulfatase A-like enzyme